MAQEQVLVVDDEEAVRNIVAALLQRSGFTPTLVAGADEALQMLHDKPGIDLVLSDVMMPGTDGLHLLDRILADFPSMPVVMCTAVHDIHIATSAFRRGAVDYLLKPFERSQLITVVTRAAEHGRLLRENSEYRRNLEEIVSLRTGCLEAAHKELERSHDITLEALADALDLRDAETEGHCRRVTAYTTELARAIGIDDVQLSIVARGAFLHDVGKIATPDSVLLKPGPLTPAETRLMREHCERGYSMVRKIPFLREAAEIVYAHQEHFDGSGYPRALQGEQIPLGARIFAIADTLDAITSDRPYRQARSFPDARAEIARFAGTQFDPVIVKVFLRIPCERWATLRAGLDCLESATPPAMLCNPERAVA
jgi:putative nucleotidyltransferase with HDIG domain